MLGRRSLVVFALVALVSCGESRVIAPPESGDARPRVDGGAQMQRFDAGGRIPADIVLVVDNSSSMASVQTKLAASIPAFLAALSSAPGAADRIIVITTDAGMLGGAPEDPDGPERAGEVTNSYGMSPYFTAMSADMTSCTSLPDIAHGCARGPDPTKRIVDLGVLSRSEAAAALIANVSVGTCGSGLEQGLSSVLGGLTKACNVGFLRADASLALVVVSDEDDSSTAAATAQAIIAASGKRAARFRLAALVGAADGVAAWCGEQASCGDATCALGAPADAPGNTFWSARPDACRWCAYFNAPGCCSAVPAERWVSFADTVATAVTAADPTLAPGCRGEPGLSRACAVDSICQADFDTSLQRAAREVIGVREVIDDFRLDPPAACLDSVRVTIERDGQSIPLTPAQFVVTDAGAGLTITPGLLRPTDEVVVDITCSAADAG